MSKIQYVEQKYQSKYELCYTCYTKTIYTIPTPPKKKKGTEKRYKRRQYVGRHVCKIFDTMILILDTMLFVKKAYSILYGLFG
jgi:hypothetical protein